MFIYLLYVLARLNFFLFLFCVHYYLMKKRLFSRKMCNSSLYFNKWYFYKLYINLLLLKYCLGKNKLEIKKKLSTPMKLLHFFAS